MMRKSEQPKTFMRNAGAMDKTVRITQGDRNYQKKVGQRGVERRHWWRRTCDRAAGRSGRGMPICDLTVNIMSSVRQQMIRTGRGKVRNFTWAQSIPSALSHLFNTHYSQLNGSSPSIGGEEAGLSGDPSCPLHSDTRQTHWQVFHPEGKWLDPACFACIVWPSCRLTWAYRNDGVRRAFIDSAGSRNNLGQNKPVNCVFGWSACFTFGVLCDENPLTPPGNLWCSRFQDVDICVVKVSHVDTAIREKNP